LRGERTQAMSRGVPGSTVFFLDFQNRAMTMLPMMLNL